MKSTMKNKTLEYYLNTRYPFIVYPAEEGGYVAEVEELPGCITQAETLEELSERIENARRAWIQSAYEDDIQIPLPRIEQDYSGRFVIRLPKYLHRQLAEEADREGVSLNQFATSLLSGAVSACRVGTKGSIDLLGPGSEDRLMDILQRIASPQSFAVGPWNIKVPEQFSSYPVIVKKLQDSPEEKVLV